MSVYVPTTGQIRAAATSYAGVTWTGAEFDRWLAQVQAEVLEKFARSPWEFRLVRSAELEKGDSDE